MRGVFVSFVALLTRNVLAKRCVFADLYTWFIYNTLYNRLKLAGSSHLLTKFMDAQRRTALFFVTQGMGYASCMCDWGINYREGIWSRGFDTFRRSHCALTKLSESRNDRRMSVGWCDRGIRENAFLITTTVTWTFSIIINPLTAKLFNLNFHPLEVVSRWRDPQLQVSENYADLIKWRSTVFKYCWLMSHFIFNMFKRWYLMCQ